MVVNQYLNLVLVLAISFILFRFTLLRCRKHKNLPPGPKALPMIGHLHLLKRPVHRTLHELSKKYGHVMFLQLGVRKLVVISSPKAAEECFTKNDIIFANRPQMISGKLLNYDSSTMGLSSYGHHWRNLRRITALAIFSQNRLALFSNIRQEEVHYFLKELCEESSKIPIKVVLRSKFLDLTLNIMMRMIAGKRYYGKDVMNEEARQFQEVVKEMVEFHGIINIEDYLPVFRWVDIKGLKKRMVILMKKMDRLFQNLIDEHRKIRSGSTQMSDASIRNKQMKKKFIDMLIPLQDREPDFLSDQTIKSLILSLLGGGTETTTTTLEWAMSLLLSHPDALKKALAEIESCVGQDRLLDENDLPKLNYLNNIITETIRLYPPLPLLLPHESLEDCVVCGYEVPKGTMLFTNLWTIQRDPTMWDEPTKFKPERFNGKEGDIYKLIPFGAGRRACPGANLGRRVIALTLGALIQSFDWERIGEEEIDMMEGPGITMPKAKPLEVLCRPRKIGITHLLHNLPSD